MLQKPFLQFRFTLKFNSNIFGKMIGGDMLLEDCRFTVGSKRDLFTLDSKPVSWLSAISIILCLMCSYDSQMMDSLYSVGVINALLACAIAVTMNNLASALFVRTWRFNFGTQYADIFQDTFGTGKTIVRIIYLITLVYSAFTTLVIGHDSILMFVEPLLGKDTIITNNYIIYYLITPLFILPFIAVKRFPSLRFFFLVGNIALLLILATSIYFFATSLKENGFNPDKKLKIFSKDFWGTVNGYSAWSVVFWAQPFLCNVAQFLPNTKQISIIGIMILTTFICAFINILMSLCYHFTLWGSCESNDFLSCLPQKNWFTSVGQFGSAINCLVTGSGYVILAARELIYFFSDQITTLGMFFSSCCIVLLCIALSDYYDETLGKYIDFIGKLTFCIMATILPPILYLKAFRLRTAWGIIALIYLIFALALTCLTMKVSVSP